MRRIRGTIDLIETKNLALFNGFFEGLVWIIGYDWSL